MLVPASWATVSFLRANIQAYVFLVEIELMLDVRAPRSMHVEDVLNRMLLCRLLRASFERELRVPW